MQAEGPLQFACGADAAGRIAEVLRRQTAAPQDDRATLRCES